MSVLKTTSAKAIIAYADMKFKFTNSAWIGEAIEFIGVGLGLIGYIGAYTKKPYPVVVKNQMAAIPCGIEQLIGVEEYVPELGKGVKINPLDSYRGIKGDYVETDKFPLKWYYLNPNYIHFSANLEGKTINLWADGLVTDEEGWCEVPDTPEHKEALSWFILTNLLARGQSHPVFDWKTANANWELWWARASNAAKHQSLDEKEKFKNNWTSWANDFKRNSRFFGTNIMNEDRVLKYTPKSDLVRSIIHIEPDTTT